MKGGFMKPAYLDESMVLLNGCKFSRFRFLALALVAVHHDVAQKLLFFLKKIRLGAENRYIYIERVADDIDQPQALCLLQ